jgi:hypothetical protein
MVFELTMWCFRLPGPPLTEQNAVAALRAANVTVALGVTGSWAARNTRFDVGWASFVFLCICIQLLNVRVWVLGGAGSGRCTLEARCDRTREHQPREAARRACAARRARCHGWGRPFRPCEQGRCRGFPGTGRCRCLVRLPQTVELRKDFWESWRGNEEEERSGVCTTK